MTKLIDSIDLPAGLRTLSVEQLRQVVGELRDELIEAVSEVGGHFASSLGAAEITVAIHSLFDTPNDRLIWDVGHQAYIHKMLTGRRHLMKTIRRRDGISGFLKPCESEYDVFGAGHAGTSISAAVGVSAALQRKNPEGYVVSVIGDGSMTAGMAFEAMNHAGSLGLKKFIVVLNDNEMSISPNVGAISFLFSKAITSRCSTIARSRFKNLYQQGYVPELIYKLVDRWEEATQGFFASAAMLFESFGFRYIGPVDGHNMKDLVEALEHARNQDVPVLIHAYTTKGKGYEPAENDPIKWHGVNPFDRNNGEFVKSPAAAPSFTSVFGDTILEMARANPKIVAITAAMAGGTGLEKFHKELPESFFDVGICEQHAVTFAAGLAREGYRPVCAIYSTFLQRAYDQVVHDVCIQNLPVVFAVDRAGVVGNDGETHQGVFDIGYLGALPNMTVMSPKDENELRHMLHTALEMNSPVAVRYPRGNGIGVKLDDSLKAIPLGKAEICRRGEDVMLVCFGPLVYYGLQVAERLLEEKGISATVVNARFSKPLDVELFAAEIPNHRLVCTLEDHSLSYGFGSAVLEMINNNEIALQAPVKMFGVGDNFVAHSSQAEQHAMLGYDVDSIFNFVASSVLPQRLAAIG